MKLTKEQLSELESVIRTLVPESMELSFGCRISIKGRENQGLWMFLSHYVSHYGVQFMNAVHPEYGHLHFRVSVPREYGYEIIGHPLTLEHCREAVRRSAGKKRPSPTCAYFVSRDRDICGLWQDLEPWESQHDAHEFLYQYLVTEKS